jgi:ribonucleoside-diphosphate reductase alpha chain
MHFSAFADAIRLQKYSLDLGNGQKEDWSQTSARVARNVMSVAPVGMDVIAEMTELINQRKFMPGGRYLYAAGRPLHQVNNCLLLRAMDSREGWADLLHKITMSLMTGAGIGVDYSSVRPYGSVIKKTGGFATGPLALMQIVNEAGRFIMQGGSRRSAIWAGLRWDHVDCKQFITMKNWKPEIRRMKEEDYNTPAPLDGTNISVILNTEFFMAYGDPNHPKHNLAHEIYWMVVRQMLKTAEPGFSVNFGANENETLRNACTEVSSEDDSDICNLGSINMSRIGSLDEMKRVVRLGTMFLLAGTLYSDLPYHRVEEVRQKNRRLGLGLMGLHEWLLQVHKPYAPDPELEKYLKIYATSTDIAREVADQWGISRPVKTRAIAPTGTIGIVAETTTGIEPVFCVAFKRRYLEGQKLRYQYVVDPTAQRMILLGLKEDQIEDAYKLAENVEKRLAFQAWVQKFVDHGISSTINLPAWGTEYNHEGLVRQFGEKLMQYLPSLRGITCYPDGARGGQPLTPVTYAEAAANVGQVFSEQQDVCALTGTGSCGT